MKRERFGDKPKINLNDPMIKYNNNHNSCIELQPTEINIARNAADRER